MGGRMIARQINFNERHSVWECVIRFHSQIYAAEGGTRKEAIGNCESVLRDSFTLIKTESKNWHDEILNGGKS
jgi:hypothetical protein